jgi:hypothetical protein
VIAETDSNWLRIITIKIYDIEGSKTEHILNKILTHKIIWIEHITESKETYFRRHLQNYQLNKSRKWEYVTSQVLIGRMRAARVGSGLVPLLLYRITGFLDFFQRVFGVLYTIVRTL